VSSPTTLAAPDSNGECEVRHVEEQIQPVLLVSKEPVSADADIRPKLALSAVTE